MDKKISQLYDEYLLFKDIYQEFGLYLVRESTRLLLPTFLSSR